VAVDNVPLRTGAFVTGGLCFGFWLYLGIFKTDLNLDIAQWWFWGLMGLAIGGGLFVGRVASVAVRIGVWVAVGVASAMLLGAAIFNQVAEAMATLLTALGGAIIVSALPGMQPGDSPPQWEHAPEEPAPRGRKT
jgi:hypothetical protein